MQTPELHPQTCRFSLLKWSLRIYILKSAPGKFDAGELQTWKNTSWKYLLTLGY